MLRNIFTYNHGIEPRYDVTGRSDPWRALRQEVLWPNGEKFHPSEAPWEAFWLPELREDIPIYQDIPSGKRLQNYGKSPCY